MALTLRYCNLGLATGDNDGTSEANAWRTLADMRDGYAADQHIYIMNSSGSVWQEGAAITLATSAGALTPIHFEGFTSTPGDKGLCDLDMETNDLVITAANVLFEGFDIIGDQSSDEILNVSGASSHLYRCKIINNNTGSGARGLYLTNSSASNCWIETKGTSGNSEAVNLERGFLYGCRIKSTYRGILLNCGFVGNYVTSCIIEGVGVGTIEGIFAVGLNTTYGYFISSNSVWNWADGLYLSEFPDLGDSSSALIYNNVIYDVTDGIHNAQSGVTESTIPLVNNFIGGATANRYNGFGDLPLPGDVTLSADPFTNAAAGDFSLNNTAGGGALVRSAALPTAFVPGGSTNNYRDGGALQHEDAGGGGGGGSVIGSSIIKRVII